MCEHIERSGHICWIERNRLSISLILSLLLFIKMLKMEFIVINNHAIENVQIKTSVTIDGTLSGKCNIEIYVNTFPKRIDISRRIRYSMST